MISQNSLSRGEFSLLLPCTSVHYDFLSHLCRKSTQNGLLTTKTTTIRLHVAEWEVVKNLFHSTVHTPGFCAPTTHSRTGMNNKILGPRSWSDCAWWSKALRTSPFNARIATASCPIWRFTCCKIPLPVELGDMLFLRRVCQKASPMACRSYSSRSSYDLLGDAQPDMASASCNGNIKRHLASSRNTSYSRPSIEAISWASLCFLCVDTRFAFGDTSPYHKVSSSSLSSARTPRNCSRRPH